MKKITTLKLTLLFGALLLYGNTWALGPGGILPDLQKLNMSKIMGKLNIQGCHTLPRFYVNGRLHPKKYVDISRRGSSNYYVVYVNKNGRYQIKPKVPASACPGRWTPGYRSVVITQPKQMVRNQDFYFKGSAKETRIPLRLYLAVLESKLRGTGLHLNNYTKHRHGNSWHQANSSYVKLSSNLGGKLVRFNIPEAKKGRFRYYVRDVNMQSISFDVSGGRAKMRVLFESRGTEIKGRCAGSIWCAGASDGAAPDVQMNNARIDISIKPAVSANGSLTYDGSNAIFSAKIQAQGVCKYLDVCNLLTHYKREIKNSVQNGVRNALNNRTIRDKVATALRPLLTRYGIGRITGVRINGNELVIWHMPRISTMRMRIIR